MTTKTMHRRDDIETAIAAAESILPKVNELQQRVLAAWRRFHRDHDNRGATDGEIEALAEFHDLRPTTVRKRRLELERAGYLKRTDERRNRMIVFEPVPATEVARKAEAQRDGLLF